MLAAKLSLDLFDPLRFLDGKKFSLPSAATSIAEFIDRGSVGLINGVLMISLGFAHYLFHVAGADSCLHSLLRIKQKKFPAGS